MYVFVLIKNTIQYGRVLGTSNNFFLSLVRSQSFEIIIQFFDILSQFFEIIYQIFEILSQFCEILPQFF